MKKPSKIQAIKNAANQMILDCTTPEQRGTVQTLTESLLVAANAYSGFQYVEWENGGFSAWKAAGSPEDKKPFLGDQSKIRFL